MTQYKVCDECGFKGNYNNIRRVSIADGYTYFPKFDICLNCLSKLKVRGLKEAIEQSKERRNRK